MSDKLCPNCRKPLATDAPRGMCPECLIKSGLPTESVQAMGRFTPPPTDEMASLFPQLEILGFIGKGGMGAVYKAKQPGLDRLVALKVLPPAIANDSGFAERFNREARALARLSHPNIVAIHDFGRAGGYHYLLMEFVDGANLREIEQAGKLSPEQALGIVPQICDALQFAHSEGIVHRDIKPENLLLDKKGRLKITDFGIAKIVGIPAKGSLTGAKDVVGTPHYMAPEQIEKPQTVDHRADIYSLGVVFYEMLTGELPLGRFAPPSKKVTVDVRLDEVVLHALEKEPERRYQQASQMKTDVETIATSENDHPKITAPTNRLTTLIFNPSAYFNGGGALAAGLAAILLTGLIGSATNTHFDGVLDIHPGAASPLWFFLSEGVVDWLCLGLVLFLFGRIASPNAFRAVDLLGTQAIARWPALLTALIVLPKAFQRFGNSVMEDIRQGQPIELNTSDAAIFSLIITVMIPLCGWMVWLMFKSYSVSCRLKTARAVGTFIPALLLAEALSKFAWYWLLKLT